MSPKSQGADGTPKKRWSAAERAARGHIPRRRGGLPRTPERTGRPARDTGPRADTGRALGEWSTRPPRDDRPQRDDRPAFNRDDRPQRSDRPSFNRDDRPQRSDRPSFNRDDRPQRSDRPAFNRDDRPQRSDRPSFNRDDRPQRSDRPSANRDDRPQRSDRPSFNRDDRPQRSDRPSFNRDDRPQRSDRPSFNRDDRPQRSDRPSFNRDDRPQRSRDDRSSSNRDDRPSSYNRDDRPQRSDDRPPRSSTGRPSFFDSYDDKRAGNRPYAERSDRSHHASSPRTSQVRPPRERDADREPVEVEPTEDVTPTPAFEGTFADLGVPDAIVATLDAQGITTPFPIQAATIPDALVGRDVLGRGQTGSGKTLAFGLPMIANLAGGTSGKPPRGLVLVPTRELAMQVNEALEPLARVVGLSTVLIAGGMSYVPQLRAFSRGVDIVIATPGRLIDLMEQGELDLSQVEVTVLDEADHMADLGFLPAVTTILDTVPGDGQRLLFSATLDSGVSRVVERYLTDPVTHEVDSARASVTTMTHHLVTVAPHDKAPVTAEIAARAGRTIVFVRTQRGADRVAEQLRAAGVLAGALHGGLTQGARTRILEALKEGKLPVLVATDVAARGIHVDDVGLILQVDPPAGSKDYLHRAGRTARAGDAGVVVSLVLPHQRREVTRLLSQAAVRADTLTGTPGAPELDAITGGRAPSGVAVSDAEFRAIVDPPVRPRGGARGRRPGGSQGRPGQGARGGPRRSPRTDRPARTETWS